MRNEWARKLCWFRNRRVTETISRIPRTGLHDRNRIRLPDRKKFRQELTARPPVLDVDPELADRVVT